MTQQPTIRDRLRDPKIVSTYRNMISTCDIETVKELRQNLKDHAEGHSKQVELETLFAERLGE